MLPSGPAVSRCTGEYGVGIVYSVTWPDGVTRATRSAPSTLYQTLPSGPAVMPKPLVPCVIIGTRAPGTKAPGGCASIHPVNLDRRHGLVSVQAGGIATDHQHPFVIDHRCRRAQSRHLH